MDDLLGKTDQYMLNAFAIDTADENSEFYTTDNIVDLITTLIESISFCLKTLMFYRASSDFEIKST